MSKYTIYKKSGTYSELLETYGLANFLHKIFDAVNLPETDIVISDMGGCYEVSTSIDITDETISKLKYFPLFKNNKQKQDSNVNEKPAYYDYPTQFLWKKEQQDLLKKAYTIKDSKERRREIERINNVFEQEKPRDIEYDVYSQIVSDSNNIPAFNKLYAIFSNYQGEYIKIVKNILSYYQGKEIDKELSSKLKKTKSYMITSLQLFNPSQGKGLKAEKANKVTGDNFDCLWISEAMKISGALSDMICQLVKVGGNYDLKIFVPEYKQLNYNKKHNLIPKFKKYTKGNTPIKIDISCILLLVRLLIENTEFSGQRRRIKDIVTGLHSVYQKKLGQKRAVSNIGFIQIPDFIEICCKDDVQDWIEIIDEQRFIINKMDEEKGATPGLMMYRDFLSSSNIYAFLCFSFWYAEYQMNQLSKQKRPKAFTFKTLNKIYASMDKNNLNLKDIIENDGFQAVAEAIRKSTVSLQYAPKDTRKYEIRYGVAQALQTKSRTKGDLAEYIGEFIALYNAETSRKAEKEDRAFRKNVREDKLTHFFELLNDYSPKLIGALLASYGFALPNKEQSDDDEGNYISETEE